MGPGAADCLTRGTVDDLDAAGWASVESQLQPQRVWECCIRLWVSEAGKSGAKDRKACQISPAHVAMPLVPLGFIIVAAGGTGMQTAGRRPLCSE